MKISPGNLLVVSLAALTLSVHAATIINPVSVTLTDADEFFPAAQIIDGSGLSSQANTGDPLPDDWTHAWGNPAGESWVTTDPGGFPADWFLVSGTIPAFVLDLGQNSLLNTVHLWAYSGGAGGAGVYQGNSAKTLEFRFNTAAEGNAVFIKPPVTLNIDHGLISETTVGSPMPRQDFDVGAQTARYVQMRITDNWYVAPGDGTTQDEHGHPMRGGDRVGLGEVRFSIPEAGTCALLVSGLVLFVRCGFGRKSLGPRMDANGPKIIRSEQTKRRDRCSPVHLPPLFPSAASENRTRQSRNQNGEAAFGGTSYCRGGGGD